MAQSKKRVSLQNTILVLFILIFLISYGLRVYNLEVSNNPMFGKKLNAGDIGYLYSSYILDKPDISALPAYGSPEAPITLVGYMDTESQATKEFFNVVFPQLEEEFIKTNKLRYYHKSYLTGEDYAQKTKRFSHAVALYCMANLKSREYYGALSAIVSSTEPDDYAMRYDIGKDEWNSCLQLAPAEIRNDIAEIERIGVSGMKQRLYIGIEGGGNKIIDGIPSHAFLRRNIRQYLFQIGESA